MEQTANKFRFFLFFQWLLCSAFDIAKDMRGSSFRDPEGTWKSVETKPSCSVSVYFFL